MANEASLLGSSVWEMKCSRCKKVFEECLIDESHDVPCYLFYGLSRNEKKSQADIFGRRWLCKGCHKQYEDELQQHLRECAIRFANNYFKETL